MRLIFVVFLFASYVFGAPNITLDWLKSKPSGNARDFYIWRFLEQDINKSVAQEAYALKSHINKTLQQAFKKYDDGENILESHIQVPIITKKTTFEEQVANPKNIILFVTDLNKTKAQLAMLDFNNTNITFNESFYLFVNAIRHNEHKKARKFLDLAKQKAVQKTESDKVLFWEYKAFDNNDSLTKLASSYSTNLYSLYASQKLKTKLSNIVYDINVTEKNETKSIDTQDPFLCLQCIGKNAKTNKTEFEYYKNIFESSPEYKTQLAYLLNIINDYKTNYFLTPFEKYLSQTPLQRKALIYAIARQESRFLPNIISPAFAIGAMQIMPFVSKDIAKQLAEPYDIEAQFNPQTNLRYANKVIDIIHNDFKHPLFVAYAYNGGVGMLKRQLKKGYFNLGKYEPFLSLELFPVGESREYAKQVLTNYVIYSNYFGEQILIDDLLTALNDWQK